MKLDLSKCDGPDWEFFDGVFIAAFDQMNKVRALMRMALIHGEIADQLVPAMEEYVSKAKRVQEVMEKGRDL